MHAMNAPGRNEPCPCGSGRKYKLCCLGKRPQQPVTGSPFHAFVVAISVTTLILFCVLLALPSTKKPHGRHDHPIPDRTGAAWEYDAATDHYWDPTPGHDHWHCGRPPPESERPPVDSPEVPPGSQQSNPEEQRNSKSR